MISTPFISRRSQGYEQNTKSFDAYRLGVKSVSNLMDAEVAPYVGHTGSLHGGADRFSVVN